MPIKTHSYDERRGIFEAHLKRFLRFHYEMGNMAMPIEGGDPSDYGYLDDEDMASILEEAAKAMSGAEPLAYLYHQPPLPEQLKEALDNLDNEYQQLEQEMKQREGEDVNMGESSHRPKI